MKNAQPLFRTTVWPADPIDVPPVRRMEIQLVKPGTFEYVQAHAAKPIPDELALRVVPRLDVDDEQALLAFMAEHGPLTIFDPLRDGRVSVAEVQERVRRLRAIVAHWHAYDDADDDGVLAAWSENGFETPKSIDMAWDWWVDFFNEGLAQLQVHIEVVSGDPPVRHGWEWPQITSYTAMLVQIRNDIATKTAWRRCANEMCGDLFARQQGRAEAGQNRSSGVRYCTKACAKAQVQRERRRRLSKQGKGNDA